MKSEGGKMERERDGQSPGDGEIEAFIGRLIEEASHVQLPELFSHPHPDALYTVPDRNGISVVALRTTSLTEEQLLKVMKYRLGQPLHPAVGIVNARAVYEAGLEHEPLSGVLADDVHIIAGSAQTGDVLCYAALRTLAPASHRATLRERNRPLLGVEKIHGWGIYNRLQVLPDLPVGKIRELGRFIKNQRLHTFHEAGARASVEISLAVLRILFGALRCEGEAVIGDLEEDVAQRHLDFFQVPRVIIRGTVPYEPEDGMTFPRYQSGHVYPFAWLTSDVPVDRLDEIEAALNVRGKGGLVALLSLKRGLQVGVSTLEPSGGLPPLAAVELPQRELAMPERRRILDLGDRLRTRGLFSGLSVSEAAVLGTFMEKRRVEAGAPIVRQGEAGEELFLIEAGEAEVRLRSPSGATSAVAALGPGEYFGEIALLNGGRRTADVIAVTSMSLLVLSSDAYLRYLAHMVEVAQLIHQTAATRASDTLQRLMAESC